MRDHFNLAEAGFINSPSIEEWPKTVGIVGVTCSPVDGFRIAFDRAIPEAWKWPSNPAVPSDNFQYTVWFFLNIRNQWLGAGFVQMWQGRMEQGGHPIPPIFAVPPGDSVPGWKNLWGDPARWPILSDHVPAPGEQVGILVTAGNARLVGGVTSVAERSQVVLLTLRADDVGNVVYLPDDTAPRLALPDGYSSDPAVGFQMLVGSMSRHNLTPVGVQGHGQQIVDALNADYPGLGVYLSSTDSPVWPGFGSLDVTIDSGKGGWEFRPDGYFPYDPSHAPAPPPVVTPPVDPPPLPPLDWQQGINAIRDDVAELHADVDAAGGNAHVEHMQIVNAIAGVLDRLNGIIATPGPSGPAPVYEGQVSIPFFGTVKIVLTPRK